MSGFAQALPIVLRSEGGYVDDPDDRGGATNQGITQRAYDAYRTGAHRPTQPVKLMAEEERDAIYYADYWLAGKCDAVPWPLALGHFDAVVNHGARGAWRIMQRALGVTPDGNPGPQTLAALQSRDLTAVRWRWIEERTSYFVAICEANPRQLKFLRGWLRARVLDLSRAML